MTSNFVKAEYGNQDRHAVPPEIPRQDESKRRFASVELNSHGVVPICVEDGYFAALISVILISNDKVFPASG
jgi:hypothetical protein